MKFTQFKLIKVSDKQNMQDWENGSVFNSALPAYRLRIQTEPNVNFNLNNSLSWCTTGYDGIYELDLGSSQPLITSLRFSHNSLDNLSINSEILVEVFYNGGYV